jgi:hypothetical protein
VFVNARNHNQPELAGAELKAWLSWARRSRLEPYKRLAVTLKVDLQVRPVIAKV